MDLERAFLFLCMLWQYWSIIGVTKEWRGKGKSTDGIDQSCNNSSIIVGVI